MCVYICVCVCVCVCVVILRLSYLCVFLSSFFSCIAFAFIFFFASFFLFFFNYYLQCTIKVTLTCRFKRHSEHGVVSLEYHAVSRLIGISLSLPETRFHVPCQSFRLIPRAGIFSYRFERNRFSSKLFSAERPPASCSHFHSLRNSSAWFSLYSIILVTLKIAVVRIGRRRRWYTRDMTNNDRRTRIVPACSNRLSSSVAGSSGTSSILLVTFLDCRTRVGGYENSSRMSRFSLNQQRSDSDDV